MAREQNVPATRQRYQVTLAVLAVGGIAYALLQSLVLPALPEIQRSLHASETSVSWVLTAYLLSASVGTPILGRLGDMTARSASSWRCCSCSRSGRSSPRSPPPWGCSSSGA